MRFTLTAIFTLLSLSVLSAFSQSNPVKIKISVFDNATQRALAGVNIIDPKISATFATNGKGYAEYNISWRDTLFVFFPGYKTTLHFCG